MDHLMFEMQVAYLTVLHFYHRYNAFLVYLNASDMIYQLESFVVVLMYLETAHLMDLGGYKPTVVSEVDMVHVVKRAMSYRLSCPCFSRNVGCLGYDQCIL
jgi:predicted DNA-binding protein (UPF0278 family)